MAAMENNKNEQETVEINTKESREKNATFLEKRAGTRRAPFAVVEAYKTIRTNLTFLLSAAKSNVIAISSAEVSDGKSTTSVNIAIAFSQLGKKVLLIDADLRRSSLHKKLKLENDRGLSTVLAGMDTLETAVKHNSDTLDVLTAGQVPPNPSELLDSVSFKELIEKASHEYSYVIVDTPPITVVTDALIVGAVTKGVVLVVREGHTTTDALDKAIAAAKFANINILGAIMNGVNGGERSKYYRYRYRYYGRRRRYGNYYKYGGYGKYGYGSRYGYGGYGYGYGNNAYAEASKKQDGKDKSKDKDKGKDKNKDKDKK